MDLINVLMVSRVPKIEESTFWCFHFFAPKMAFAPIFLETETKQSFLLQNLIKEQKIKDLGATVTRRTLDIHLGSFSRMTNQSECDYTALEMFIHKYLIRFNWKILRCLHLRLSLSSFQATCKIK